MAGLPMAPTSDPDSSLVPRGLPIETDAFGNEIVRFGSGRPLTLVAVRRDVPAYFVTSITPDGYLRVQNQGSSPSLLWDQFQIGRRVFVTTRDGRVLPGVVAAPNTHFRRGYDVPIPEATVDDIYVDVGAENDKQARAMGIENLCVVSQVGKLPFDLGHARDHRWFGPGAAVVGGAEFARGFLSRFVEHANHSSQSGTFVFSWIAQGSAGGRGVEPIARRFRPDVALVICPYVRALGDTTPGHTAKPAGPLIVLTAIGPKSDSLKAVLRGWEAGRPDPISAALGRMGIPVAQIGIVVGYPGTPGEGQLGDAQLEGEYFGDKFLRTGKQYPIDSDNPPMQDTPSVASLVDWPPATSPISLHQGTWDVLAPLVHAQGISEHEDAVRDTVLSLIPKSLEPVTDSHGNVIV